MSLAHRIVLAGFKLLTRVLCRIDGAQLEHVPARGPLILVANHTNIVEVPLIYTHLLPRPVTCFVASYRWRNRFLQWLLDGTRMIPLRRGEPDIRAFREGLRRLELGEIVIIAPEGTRSGNGQLQRAKAGVAPLALWSGAPLQPLVFYGHEDIGRNVRHLRRSDFHIVVGEPFQLDTHGSMVNREVRQAISDEIMGRLARLLPPPNRGFYAGSDSSPERYVIPLKPSADPQTNR